MNKIVYRLTFRQDLNLLFWQCCTYLNLCGIATNYSLSSKADVITPAGNTLSNSKTKCITYTQDKENRF